MLLCFGLTNNFGAKSLQKLTDTGRDHASQQGRDLQLFVVIID